MAARTAAALDEDATAAMEDGDLAGAAATFAAALAVARPEERKLRLELGLKLSACLAHLDRFPEAEAACDAVLALDRTNLEALLRRGTARRVLGNVAGARLDLMLALELLPEPDAPPPPGATAASIAEAARLRGDAEAQLAAMRAPPPRAAWNFDARLPADRAEGAPLPYRATSHALADDAHRAARAISVHAVLGGRAADVRRPRGSPHLVRRLPGEATLPADSPVRAFLRTDGA